MPTAITSTDRQATFDRALGQAEVPRDDVGGGAAGDQPEEPVGDVQVAQVLAQQLLAVGRGVGVRQVYRRDLEDDRARPRPAQVVGDAPWATTRLGGLVIELLSSGS